MKKTFIYCEPQACRRRYLDADRICKYLSINGHKIVDKLEDADIILFVTCTAVDETTKISLEKIRKFQKYDAELIVAGCLPIIEKEKLAEIFNGKTIGTKDLNDIDQLFPENKIKFKDTEDANILFQNVNDQRPFGAIKKIFGKSFLIEKIYFKARSHVLKNLLDEHSAVYRFFSISAKYREYCIRISRGCTGNCSYCAIKKAIGSFHSKTLDQCLDEFRNGLKKGYKKFVIVADDAGSYGIDIGTNLPELLNEMTKIEGDYEIVIRSLDPHWVVKYIDDLEEILKRQKIVYVDIAIQSGSSYILKLMRRFSDVEKMRDVFLRLKKSTPNLSLFTHVIVGFPTETMEDLKQTLSFINNVDFNSGLIFPFSCKTGTEVENIEPKISQEEIAKRLRYAKKFLKKAGYNIIYISKINSLLFHKRK